MTRAGPEETSTFDPAKPDYTNHPASSRRPQFAYAPCDPSAVPVVSIVTASFNSRDHLRETSVAVFRQSFQQWEWIIVNDGSSDPASLTLLEGFRRMDPRVRVIDHVENRGLSAALNTGARVARSDFIFLLDDDDLIEPTTIEKCLWYLLSHPEAAFVNGFSVGFGSETFMWDRGFHQGAEFRTANQVTGRVLVRRCVHQEVGGFDESNRGGTQDWDFWMRCAAAGRWGATIPEVFDWHRRRGVDHWARWQHLGQKRSLRAFRRALERKYSHVYRGAFPRLPEREWKPFSTSFDPPPWTNALVKARRRILILVAWFNYGGAERFNLDLTRQLNARGWEVSILATRESDGDWMPAFAGATPDVFSLTGFLSRHDMPRFFVHFIESRRPDVVLIAGSELGYWLLPYLCARCPEPAYVDYCHIEEPYWKNGGYPRYSAASQAFLDLSVVSSEDLRGRFVARGADPRRVAMCTTNVDSDWWRPDQRERAETRRELSVQRGQCVVLFVGRLVYQKNALLFARTLERILEEGRDVVGLVAGDGNERTALETFLTRNGLRSRIHLLGAVSKERVQQLMNASDVFFLPSRMEGIAVSIFEAMAMSLPVVAADVGGQSELVDAETGILVRPTGRDADVEAYARALLRLVDDPALRRALGTTGRRRIVAAYSLSAMGARMLELLEVAVARPRDRSAFDRGQGEELAARAVEYFRMEECLQTVWGTQGPALVPALGVSPLLWPHPDSASEIALMERSGWWRLYQWTQRTFLYRALTRLGLRTRRAGEPYDDEQARFASIRLSRYYRALQALRRSRLFRHFLVLRGRL